MAESPPPTRPGAVAEPRQGPVADRAGADAAVLESLLRREAQVVRPRPGGHDHGNGLIGLAVRGGQGEGLAGEVDGHDVLGDDPRLEVDGLLPHERHQFRAADAVLVVRGHQLPLLGGDGGVEIGRQVAGGKAGEVFHLGGQVELPQGERAGQAVLLASRRPRRPAGRVPPGRRRWRPSRRPGRCR